MYSYGCAFEELMDHMSNKNIKFSCKYCVFWIIQGNGRREGAQVIEKRG